MLYQLSYTRVPRSVFASGVASATPGRERYFLWYLQETIPALAASTAISCFSPQRPTLAR